MLSCCLNLLQQVGDDLRAVLVVRAHAPDLRRPAAGLAFALDDEDRQSHACERERGAHAGHAGSDNQNARLGFYPHRGQGCRQGGLGHAGAHDVDALQRGAELVTRVHPGALFAQIDVNVLVGIQPGAFRHGAEREHVKLRGTRGDDQAIQLLFLDLVDHLLLRSIRAGEQMCPRDLDFRFASGASSATSFTFTWSEMFPPQWQT